MYRASKAKSKSKTVSLTRGSAASSSDFDFLLTARHNSAVAPQDDLHAVTDARLASAKTFPRQMTEPRHRAAASKLIKYKETQATVGKQLLKKLEFWYAQHVIAGDGGSTLTPSERNQMSTYMLTDPVGVLPPNYNDTLRWKTARDYASKGTADSATPSKKKKKNKTKKRKKLKKVPEATTKKRTVNSTS